LFCLLFLSLFSFLVVVSFLKFIFSHVEFDSDVVSSFNSYSDYIHDDYLAESDSSVAFDTFDQQQEDEESV
jgi:hypothetical protein